MNPNSNTLEKPSKDSRKSRNEELVLLLADFLEAVGGVDLTISNEMILLDIDFVAQRSGSSFEADFVRQVPRRPERLLLLKRAKREVLRRFFQTYVDEIADLQRELDDLDDEEREEQYRALLQNLANYLPGFAGRPADIRKDHAWLMTRSFFGARLSPHDLRYWTNQLLAAAGLIGQPVVYFISFDDPTVVKIGWAGNLRRRISALRVSAVSEPTVHLVLQGGKVLEGQLHKRFDADGIRGELFRLSPQILEFIKENAGQDPP